MLPPALHWWWENGVKVYGGMFIRSFVPIWRPCQWHRPTERQARKDNPTDDNISSDGSSSDVPVDMPDKTFSALLWWAMGCARWWRIVSPSAVPPSLPLFVVPKRHHITGLLGRQQRRWWVVVNLPWTVYRLSSKQYSKPREMFLPISITSFLIFYVIHPYHQAMGVILNTWRVYWQSQEGDNSHVGHRTIFVMRHTETDKKRGRQWRVFLKVKRFIATVVSSHDNVNWLAICPLTGVVLVGRVSSG